MRSQYTFSLRFISAVSLFFFMWSFAGLRDVALAAKDGLDTPALKQERMKKELVAKGKRPEVKLEKAVADIEKIVNGYAKKKTGAERKAEKEKLKLKKKEIQAHDLELRKQFAETERRIIERKLSKTKLKVHREFVKAYEADLAALNRRLDAVEQAKTTKDTGREIEIFKAYIKKVKVEKKRPKIDFDNLSHRNAEPTKLKPRLKKEEFQTIQKAKIYTPEHGYSLIYPDRDLSEDGFHPVAATEPLRVAALGALPDLGIEKQSFDLTAQGPEMTFESPMLLAAASDLPTAKDLDPTIDVQMTEAVIAKAAELGNDPLKIYEWVRNNIEFAPTWGSIQGADYCLQTELCNSFDTASLLIAMLRASNVPARYVHGTIELPIDKAMNWAGDFTDASAALQFMSAGGIPTGQVIEGGKITRAHFEHVWVEAWIDYLPSRGARHKNGQGDSWIPLDASYKQYNYTQGLDIASEVPFDAESFVNQLTSTATINEEQGYVTGVDSTYVQQTMTGFQTQVEDYITTNYPDATVGDVLGTKEIKAENYSYLLGTLPYKRVVTGTRYSDLSDALRHRWSMNLAGYAPISYSATLPELAGKKITLSYSPATPDDEAVIESYLPEPHADGTPIDSSELPSSLPAYLINLKPELRIDGEVVAEGGPVMMGITEDFYMNFYFPGKGTTPVHNTNEAGDYAGIALNLGRVSQEHLTKIKTGLEATRAKLEAQDFGGLTKDDLLGDFLSATALAYYAKYDVQDYLSGRTIRVNNLRLPSESMFYNDLKITHSFFSSQPLSAAPGGLVMDVDYNVMVARDSAGSHDKMIQLMRTSGVTSSALEHVVPEKLFSNIGDQADGISAVKALHLANGQGIPIYTINQSNINIALPQLQLDADVINDIVNAVAAGKDVTVPETNISVSGWDGCGYIVFDTATGAGVYMISGGLNGGVIKPPKISQNKVFFIASVFVNIAITALIGTFWIGLLASIAFFCVMADLTRIIKGDYSLKDFMLGALSFVAWLSIGVAIGAIISSVATIGLGIAVLGLALLLIPLIMLEYVISVAILSIIKQIYFASREYDRKYFVHHINSNCVLRAT
ncbi:MAG: transglutaminase-like domain-containing protein [Thermodesulfobacteriota bacterium]